MAFDETKDKKLKAVTCGNVEVSLRQYNGGDVKVQIGPRFYENKSGERKPAKCGRLSLEEASEIHKAIEKLLDEVASEGTGQDII